MERRNGGSGGKILLIVVLASMLIAFTRGMETQETKLDLLTARAKELARSQAKLESKMKGFAKQVKQVKGVWRDRKRQVEERLQNKLNMVDLQKAGWSTITALAEVGFILPMYNASNASVDQQMKNVYAAEHNRLTKNVETLNKKKAELEEKMKKIRELKEKVQNAKDAYDLKLESYKRKLNLFKFKESLTRVPPADRSAMIAQKTLEEQKIKIFELSYIDGLKNSTVYNKKKLEEKLNQDKVKKSGLHLPAKISSISYNNQTQNATSPNTTTTTNTTQNLTHPQPNPIGHSLHQNLTNQSNQNATVIIVPNYRDHNRSNNSSSDPLIVINNHQTYVKVTGNGTNQSSSINISNSTGVNEQQGPFIVIMNINASIPINVSASNGTGNAANRSALNNSKGFPLNNSSYTGLNSTQNRSSPFKA